jgi:hypothetical protein
MRKETRKKQRAPDAAGGRAWVTIRHARKRENMGI